MHRVWITGRGVVSPLGSTPDALADALEQQRSGVRLLPGAAALGITPYTCVGASIGNDPGGADVADPQWSASLLALLDRNAMLGLRAAQAAWQDAGLAQASLDPQRAALAWGCGMGGAATAEQSYADLFAPSPRRLHPYVVVRTMNNAAAAHIAMRHGLQGPLLSVSNACASAAQAIGEGMHWVRSGRADLVVVGGSEALLVPGVIRAWQAMGVLARTDLQQPEASCRPFDRRRNGLVLGEGAGALVLESEAHARARGARPLAELAGYGSSCDATHLSRPDEAGQVRAMRQALQDAGLQPAQVGHLNAHGTGTPVGDAVEARSIHAVFGGDGPRPAVAATKALHGHLMGASGAVELIASLEALRRGRLPPSAHVSDSDCLAWIDLIEGAVRSVPVEAVMSNSFAFGGANASLVLRHAVA
ncbi:MAG: beta-ketoacyl-[acyl-carrier-protein] synthase family protein [Burkholderiales bacterium]